MKLDVWKLENPRIEVEGRISLPMNQQHPQNLIINDYSLKNEQKKAIGGLISSPVRGTFIHLNTIEEYQALDLNAVVAEEAKKVLDADDLNTFNRFVIVTFGDLKNYLYHHR
jgi:Ubiquitin-like modifier-activating enzyme ATG7 N-terminus